MQTELVLPTVTTLPTLLAPPMPLPAEHKVAREPVAPLLLLGLDQSGKPHGARFGDADDAAAVERAADLMDFFHVSADTEALRILAVTLPMGRLFGSGRAFTPFIKRTLYDGLLAAAGIDDRPRPAKAAGKPAEAGGGAEGKPSGGPGGAGAGDPPATRVGAKAPADHSQIGLGSLVLAQGDDEDDEGYYPAKVILTKANDHFVLTWADYPDLPEFSRPRRALALLHPETAAEAG
ncbi:hypothetical protein PMNALOAF_1825 [Methylobacterium adhaesivum]|uniref:Uncharacterized protein n=1 Tax=Methylobacterium adhaesivum TaxID=333297 RepID=A0ABT8BBZ0_9HYPH|nr:hypothetical protein [Methylobacterium adhaesivum]MDN3589563.1 hypothetical protein [Methylobacterium adhaesivum]GJD30578.1 hypothetical protein PMNALOAF_1825 [Methylobacterium adhaesivum]